MVLRMLQTVRVCMMLSTKYSICPHTPSGVQGQKYYLLFNDDKKGSKDDQ